MKANIEHLTMDSRDLHSAFPPKLLKISPRSLQGEVEVQMGAPFAHTLHLPIPCASHSASDFSSEK